MGVKYLTPEINISFSANTREANCKWRVFKRCILSGLDDLPGTFFPARAVTNQDGCEYDGERAAPRSSIRCNLRITEATAHLILMSDVWASKQIDIGVIRCIIGVRRSLQRNPFSDLLRD
ncbi:unnamed protein product [Dracunculus medinensis]|uniref:ZP domain-containing protein n=1 Tax=Dracunculus medinensis TaxID=318479 RepID=A0A0N4UPV5_DRAME|nr:unnamed protein product [Dracunculus medinensis]